MPKASATAAVAAAAAETGGDNEDVIMSNDNDEEATKTPATSNPAASNKTPVSSGGMTMRSGKKKKKRAAFTATTPSRKRVNKKRSAADDNDNGISGKPEGNAANKKRRMTKDNNVTVNGESNDSDEDMEKDNDDEVSDNDVEMENNDVATATKVRFETTKEAVAAAQLPESDDEDEEEEEEDDEEDEDDEDNTEAQAEAEARAAAAAAANEQAAAGWRRLLTQRLRLPSQHTPGPAVAAAAAESPGFLPPAGGRRLIFDTGVKSKGNDNNTTATTTTARNKLLVQTRTKTGSTKTSQSSKSNATSSKTTPVVQQSTTSASPPQNYPFIWLEELSKNHELKRDMIKCTIAWLSVLLIFFTLGNVTNVLGDYAWDVRQQSMQWSEWYGFLTPVHSEGLVAIKESDFGSVIAEASNDDDNEEIVTIVDPTLLQRAKAMLRAQRMNHHDIQLFENATAEIILAMKMLDSVEDELIVSSTTLSSSLAPPSVPTLSSSTTDPVAITDYIESMIATQEVLMFSKSYCPYCRATKALFRDMGVQPTVIELDEMENGSLVQDILSQMTAQDTVPNVYVKREHVGGNDDTQELAESGELQKMLSSPDNNRDDKEQIKSKLEEKQQLLVKWEHALAEVEATFGSLEDGSASQHEVNAALRSLSDASMVPISAMVLDATDIHVPGEGCKGNDYNHLVTGKENIGVDVVGGVDVDALDVASDAPLLLEDAQSAYNSLVALAQSTSEALLGPTGPSVHAQQWAQRLVEEECQKEGVAEIPSVQIDLPDDIAKKAATPPPSGAYNARAASNDIDRLLEIENADITGKFDYASVVHGARVLRRGPRATSLSLYETLPLINRVLAYSKLRFYGHPPEVALLPTTTLHAKGHCWSFEDEFSSSLASRQTQDGLRGEYATLTVALSQDITVTEVMIDHVPRSVVDGKSALKNFRVIGYEDIGAFGEPWELGSFEYDSKLGLQSFAIPTSVGGADVPKLKAVSLAVDSNWGAEYSCLYRFRVHGE
mmetsp:Transcript_25834/g.42002  ORF Transcript_25834/g.42002 Transcript_25834/m.42002 type:complete len:1006 (+) Transcript_25834:121-3138(+)